MSSRTPQHGTRGSGDYAASAAHYVVHSHRFSDKEHGIGGYGAYISPKDMSKSQHDLASAGAAASLAHQHHTEASEARRRERQSHTTTELPENRDSRVSARAAFAAMGDRGPTTTGETAERGSIAPSEQDEYLEDDPNAKLAATSVTAGHRRRAESTASARDEASDLTPAMSAATISHRTSMATERGVGGPEEQPQHPSLDSARIHNLAVARTQRDLNETRPSGIETEKAAENSRHAAVISMAQQMYALASRPVEDAASEDTSTTSHHIPRRHTLREPVRGPVRREPTRQTGSLHTLAEKRVAERLGKLDSERVPGQQGTGAHQRGMASRRPRSFGSSRVRRWSSSEGDAAANVLRRAERKPFQPRPPKPDGEVSPSSQEILALARKNVDSTMNSIDKHIYESKGKPTPAKLEKWERTAHERSDRTGRDCTTTTFVPGREAIFEDQREVDEVARSRVKPTLEDIDDKLNEQRGQDIAKKLDAEHEKDYRQRQKQREVEVSKAVKEVGMDKKKENENKIRSKDQNGKTAKKESEDTDKNDRKAEKKVEKKSKKKGKEKQAMEEMPTTTRDGPQQGESADVPMTAGVIVSGSDVKGEREEKRSKLFRREPKTEMQTAPSGIAIAEQVEGEPVPSTRETLSDRLGRGTGTALETPTESTVSEGIPVARTADEPEPHSQSPSMLGGESLRRTPNIGSGSGDEEEADEYRVRQWSTSTGGGASSARNPNTKNTATKKKQRRFLKTIFSRNPNRTLSGKQGSFDVQRRTPDTSVTETPDHTTLQADSPTQRPPPRRPPGISKFHEDL